MSFRLFWPRKHRITSIPCSDLNNAKWRLKRQHRKLSVLPAWLFFPLTRTAENKLICTSFLATHAQTSERRALHMCWVKSIIVVTKKVTCKRSIRCACGKSFPNSEFMQRRERLKCLFWALDVSLETEVDLCVVLEVLGVERKQSEQS